jgi:uncharacterized protein YfaT (DUF1175 family)
MVVRGVFDSPLSVGHSLYSVLARGATLENVSVYSYYSVKYWCVGAALLAKLWSCGRDCAGFGKCAAWAGYTLGLHLSHITSFSGYTVSFVNNIVRFISHIADFVNHIANIVSHITSFVSNIARFVNHIVSFVGHIVNFVSNIVNFVKRGAYFSSYAALF